MTESNRDSLRKDIFGEENNYLGDTILRLDGQIHLLDCATDNKRV